MCLINDANPCQLVPVMHYISSSLSLVNREMLWSLVWGALAFKIIFFSFQNSISPPPFSLWWNNNFHWEWIKEYEDIKNVKLSKGSLLKERAPIRQSSIYRTVTKDLQNRSPMRNMKSNEGPNIIIFPFIFFVPDI